MGSDEIGGTVQGLLFPACEPSPSVATLYKDVNKHRDTLVYPIATWIVDDTRPTISNKNFNPNYTKRVEQQLLYFKSMQPRVVFGCRVLFEDTCNNMHFPWLYGDVYLVTSVIHLDDDKQPGHKGELYDYDAIFGSNLDAFLRRFCEYKRVQDEYDGLLVGLNPEAVQRIEGHLKAAQQVPFNHAFVFQST
jgi:hypothetical protein